MSKEHFYLPDEPSELSISLLIRGLRTDSATKGVSPKVYAHRSRVIRQQKRLLALNEASNANEKARQAKRARKASRPPDHREEGGQG